MSESPKEEMARLRGFDDDLTSLRSRLAAVEAEVTVERARADAAEARVRELEESTKVRVSLNRAMAKAFDEASAEVAALTRERDEARLAADNAEADAADAREELSGARDATDDAITETAKHDEDADALRAQLDEAVGLLRACPTTGHQPEDQTGEGGYDVCNWCGDVAGDCDADKTCWGAKVRAFLSRLPASPGVGPK